MNELYYTLTLDSCHLSQTGLPSAIFWSKIGGLPCQIAVQFASDLANHIGIAMPFALTRKEVCSDWMILN